MGKSKPTKLKPSITPGTVLILLASGLLLVTGPHRVNGVPLRRVNQAYVIATSTKVNVKGIKLDSLSDSSFPGKKTDKSEVADTAKAVSAGRKKAQTEVDSAILTALKAEPVLGKYLKARFSLTSGMKPHEMVF